MNCLLNVVVRPHTTPPPRIIFVVAAVVVVPVAVRFVVAAGFVLTLTRTTRRLTRTRTRPASRQRVVYTANGKRFVSFPTLSLSLSLRLTLLAFFAKRFNGKL